jgi:hypothetical protein
LAALPRALADTPIFWSDFTVDTTSRDKPLNAELNFDVSLSLSKTFSKAPPLNKKKLSSRNFKTTFDSRHSDLL